eukprot:gene24941-10595_t
MAAFMPLVQQDSTDLAFQPQQSYFTRPDMDPSSANITFQCTYFSPSVATACSTFHTPESAQLFQGNIQYLGVRTARYPGLAYENELRCSQTFVDNIKLINSCSGSYVLLRPPEATCALFDPPPPPNPPRPPRHPPPPPPTPPAPVVPECEVCLTLNRAMGSLTGQDCDILAERAFQEALISATDFYAITQCNVKSDIIVACASFVTKAGADTYMYYLQTLESYLVQRYGRPIEEEDCEILATTLANLNLYVFRGSPRSLQFSFNCYSYDPTRATACATFNSQQLVSEFTDLLSPGAVDPFPSNIIIQAMGLKCVGGPTNRITGLGGGYVDMFESTTGCDVPGWVQVPKCPT